MTRYGPIRFDDHPSERYPGEDFAVCWVNPADCYAIFQCDAPHQAAEALSGHGKNVEKRARFREFLETGAAVGMPVASYAGRYNPDFRCLEFRNGRHRMAVFKELLEAGHPDAPPLVPVLIAADQVPFLQERLDQVRRQREAQVRLQPEEEGWRQAVTRRPAGPREL